MSEHYSCLTGHRRTRILASVLNGIDFLEVGPGGDSLLVTFVKSAGLGALTLDDIKVTGGVRHGPPAIAALAVSGSASNVLLVTLLPGQTTDFSTYRFTLVTLTGATPPGFDPESAGVDFSFKVECPSPFDCGDEDGPSDRPPPDPEMSYGARDWSGFRELMLDRLAALLPDFRDDTPVDHLVTQVEALAYVADHLSYRLDAIASETDLFRSRSRISMDRHGRLLGYRVAQGCNARTFVHFDYAGVDGIRLDKGTPLLVSSNLRGVTVTPDDFGAVAQFDPVTFETMHDLMLFSGNSRMAFHTWSDERCTLKKGSTAATLRQVLNIGDPGAQLGVGDFLILRESISPHTGLAADADRQKRHVVRLTSVTPRIDLIENLTVYDISWDAADALPFDLVLSVEFGSPPLVIDCAEAMGNVALADHGLTLPVQGLTNTSVLRGLTPRLEPPVAPASGAWRPRLLKGPVVRSAAVDLSVKALLPASTVRRNDAGKALAVLTLADSFKPWLARSDLLASERFDRHFVVETEYDGEVRLRFGDNIMGQTPLPGQRLTVTARIGHYSDGNIGADVLRQTVTNVPGITAVSNPLPASDGTAPIEAARIRLEAPYAFLTQERAVTEADYAEMAERHPSVARALAQMCWSGSWRTCFVYIDRVGGAPVDTDRRYLAEMMQHMDKYRLCGVDIALKGAISVPLDIRLSICVAQGALRADVRRYLEAALGSGVTGAGERGFFHPDNYTFGDGLYLSRLVAAAMAVSGVASVEVTTFVRRGRQDNGDLARGVLMPAGFEILRLDNDRNFPENGLLTLDLRGGT